jgi:hypothetical protein
MNDRGRHSLPSVAALWAAATGFWLLVTAMSAAQTVWIAQTPGQRLDVRSALHWQTAYFILWIPFTIAVWRVTRGWLPERFGGWFRLLTAHVPIAAVVAVAHSFVVTLVGPVLANQNGALWDRFVMQLRGQLNGEILIYTAVAATGAAMTLYERYRDRQMAAPDWRPSSPPRACRPCEDTCSRTSSSTACTALLRWRARETPRASCG